MLYYYTINLVIHLMVQFIDHCIKYKGLHLAGKNLMIQIS